MIHLYFTRKYHRSHSHCFESATGTVNKSKKKMKTKKQNFCLFLLLNK